MNEARGRRRYDEEGDVIDAKDKNDPVAQWLGIAGGYKKQDLEKFEKEMEDMQAGQ
jgi:hypothetical protein